MVSSRAVSREGATVYLVKQFFNRLAEEFDPALALTLAQRDFLAMDPTRGSLGYPPAHPYFWAGLVAMG